MVVQAWYQAELHKTEILPQENKTKKYVEDLLETHYRNYHLQLYFGASHICTAHLGWT